MTLVLYTALDLGDIGMHDALVEGDVTWHQTGPAGSTEGYCNTVIKRVTVNIRCADTVTVLDVTRALSRGARATLEELLEAKYLNKENGT
jgi:hypothetical protein